MRNAMDKSFQVNKKKESLGEQTTTHPHLASHKISHMFNVNQKANKK
jgi:hypothetical protein